MWPISSMDCAAAAAEEAQFVTALAEQLGLGFILGAGDPAAIRAHPDGVEAGARVQRYAFLREAAERIAARYVVTRSHRRRSGGNHHPPDCARHGNRRIGGNSSHAAVERRRDIGASHAGHSPR